MGLKQIVDWDSAYNNVGHITDGSDYPSRWKQAAQHYRNAVSCELNISYGQSTREVFDLFQPTDKPVGLVVFVHGGYWVRFDKSYWSHFATGFVKAGWAVAMPSYSLCPDVDIATIEKQIAAAVTSASSRVEGPIILSGHSAGGQLVTSLLCEETPLTPTVLSRIAHVLSVSGVHDLRPLLGTALNQQLKLDLRSATQSSPALKSPISNVKLTALVGAKERPEFVRQNALLANIWLGLGASVECIEAPGKHHFNIIDHLLDDSDLINSLIQNS